MTRINSAIPTGCLTDEHLLAEHREIKRLPHCLRQAIRSGSVRRIPGAFTLGRGHITFFLDKMRFVYDRYTAIHEAALERGFRVQSYASNWDDVGSEYWNGHSPTPSERDLLAGRIAARIMESSRQTWHYFGRPVSKRQAIELLKSINQQNNN